MPPLGKPITEVRDGENNRVSFDVAYPVNGMLDSAMRQLRQRHPERIYLLPMSAGSAGGGIRAYYGTGEITGGGVFQAEPAAPGTVVGLRFDAPAEPRVSLAAEPRLAELELDQIVIDRERRQVSAGAAVTLCQLNQALARELGHDYRVAGADLTSYLYAAVGATFMTGGMGPQRRYFSDSVDEIALYDGNETVLVGAADLAGYAGTYGWSGIVSALRCRFHRFPPNEVAFALPVRHGSEDISRLLARLAPYTRLRMEHDVVRAEANAEDLILGLEHVSIRSMQPLLRDGGDSAVVTRARELRQNCEAAGAEGLVFVNGCSSRAIDDFLLGLADSGQGDDFSIAGISLDHAEVFADPEQMRAVREAIPWAARMQGAGGAHLYKNHSDVNVRIVGDDVESCARVSTNSACLRFAPVSSRAPRMSPWVMPPAHIAAT